MGNREFPFLWGAATSSHQVEGDNRFNDWWAWELAGNIEGGIVSGRATDHWNRYEEDLKLATELGLNSYRFSVEWSRIEPEEGQWDHGALAWYRGVIDQCEKLGLLPMLTLHHFTLPLWLSREGGFANKDSPGKFLRFVEKVVDTLGPRVPLWCTINEPMSLVVGGYIGKYMPPAQFDPKGASLACRNMFEAHVLAYETIHRGVTRREGPWAAWPLQVGFAHNLIDFLPSRTWHPMERLLTQILRRYYNRSWLDAVVGLKQHFGITGLVPYPTPVLRGLGQRTVDFIGINYYTKAIIRWRPKNEKFEQRGSMPFGVSFADGGELVTDMGWSIHPAGLSRMVELVKGYGLPMYITENGIADGADNLRPRFLRTHLKEIARQAATSDIRGYYYWSLIDNFEWIKGFTPRFGIFEVDYNTFERKWRDSGRFFQKIIRAHQPTNGWPSTEIMDRF